MATRSEQAVQTKNKLIAAARKAFSENGYKGTSVRALSRSVNVSESLLYHYFPNGKRELFSEIMHDEFIAFKQEISASCDMLGDYRGVPAEKALDEMFVKITSFIKEHIDILRIVVMEKEVREYLDTDEVERFTQEIEAAFTDFLAERVEKGEMKSIDPWIAAFIFKGFLFNNILLCVLGVEPPEDIASNKRRDVIDKFFK